MARKKGARAVKATEAEFWKKVASPSPVKRAPITYDRIAQLAIKTADTEGLEAVTIRRLADALSVSPMALYRYISGKEDIFELMVDAVQPAPSRARKDYGWRDIMCNHARVTRMVMLQHPWMTELPPEARSALTPRRVASIERVLATLKAVDLDPDTEMQIVDAVTGYATGVATIEITQSRLMQKKGWSKPEDLRDALSARMTWLLDSQQYPHYERYIRTGKLKDDKESRFEFGLQALLNGIAKAVRASACAPGSRR